VGFTRASRARAGDLTCAHGLMDRHRNANQEPAVKTIAILALALVSSLAVGCVAEPTPTSAEPGLRPGYKPSLDPSLPEEQVGGNQQDGPASDRPDINESFEIGTSDTPIVRPPGALIDDGGVASDGLELEGPRPRVQRDPLLDDGRVMWVEEVIYFNSRFDYVHHFDARTGIDSIDVLDGDGELRCQIIARQNVVEMSTCGLR
jgi:hypothetical protein